MNKAIIKVFISCKYHGSFNFLAEVGQIPQGN